MKWRLTDFWGFLLPDKEKRQEKPPSHVRFSFGWGTPTGKVVAMVVIAAIFGGVAAWIIFHVVRFFDHFWGMADKLVE